MPRETAFSHGSEDLRQTPAVVLVHFGALEPTLRCLRSLVAVETSQHDVWIVNHGSPADLATACAELHPRVHLVDNPTNPGFGAGCNLGAERAFAAGACGVWFLNNDAEVTEPVLGELRALAEAHPQVGLWGTHQRDGDRRLGADQQPDWFATGLSPFTPPPGLQALGVRETLSGASIYISKAQWERLGPWPEEHFLYWEDADWCRRAHRLGLGLVLVDREVRHPRGTTTGRRSPLTTFYSVRNLFRVHTQCCPEDRVGRWKLATHLLQKRFFQGRWSMLLPTWRGIRAAGLGGRDPRY